jgi:hypothetical protein
MSRLPRTLADMYLQPRVQGQSITSNSLAAQPTRKSERLAFEMRFFGIYEDKHLSLSRDARQAAAAIGAQRLLAPGGVGAGGVALAHDDGGDAGVVGARATVGHGVSGVASEGGAEHALVADAVHGAVGVRARGPGGLGGAAEVDGIVPGAGGHHGVASHGGDAAGGEGVGGTSCGELDDIRGGPHGVEEGLDVSDILEHLLKPRHKKRIRSEPFRA